MVKQPRITVLQPDPQVPLVRFEEWLRDAGVRLSVVGLWEKDVPQLSAVGEGLLLLGGHMSAHDRRTYSWLDPLGDLLADAHSIELPILGICLGHQVLAEALGGRVAVNHYDGGEHGAVELTWLPAAAEDPIFGPIAAQGTTLVSMSHHDVVTELPAGATELAQTARYRNQVLRLGNAWGVQYHPEKAPESTARWETDSEAEHLRLVAELTAADDRVRPAAQLVASGFAKFVREEA